MGWKEFLTIKIDCPRLHTQYSSIPFFHKKFLSAFGIIRHTAQADKKAFWLYCGVKLE